MPNYNPPSPPVAADDLGYLQVGSGPNAVTVPKWGKRTLPDQRVQYFIVVNDNGTEVEIGHTIP